MKDFDKIIGRNAITMIYFFTSQCVPCEAMEPALDQFERRMAGRVDIYRINTDADENAYLLYRYMIRTTPTLIYFRKGDEIRRCEGPLTDKILLADNDGQVKVGAPVVEGASVKCKILKHLKDDKVLVFKKKRRTGYQKQNGHRQYLTQVLVEEIVA